MGFDKLDVTLTANKYSNNVKDAKNACSDAVFILRTAAATVSGYWQGEAGNEMTEALSSLGNEIDRIIWDLTALEQQLLSHANRVLESLNEDSTEK